MERQGHRINLVRLECGDIVLFERAAALCERYNHSDVQLREYVESEAKSLEAKVRYLAMFIDTMTH